MLLAAIINHMLDDLETSLTAALDKSRKEHDERARRWCHDTEARAERVLNATFGFELYLNGRSDDGGGKKASRLQHPFFVPIKFNPVGQ